MALVPPRPSHAAIYPEKSDPSEQADTPRDVPRLPAVAVKALDMLGDPDLNLRILAGVLAEDAPLAARILAISRSPYYRQRMVPGTLQAAIQVIGLRDLRNIVFTSVLRKLCGAMPEALWAHSVGAALACRILAARVPELDREQAFLAGLLHDAGQIILARDDPTGYMRLVNSAREGKIFLFEAERTHCGTSHEAIGVSLIESWNLGSAIAAAVGGHHKPHECTELKSLTALVIAADYLTLKSGLGFFAPAPEVPLNILKVFGLADEPGVAGASVELRQAFDTEGALLKIR